MTDEIVKVDIEGLDIERQKLQECTLKYWTLTFKVV